MIYGTNRIASIGEVEVEVNENYFGAGSLFFEQECAQDELALFEMTIKSDINEAIIGESADELEALNENFALNAIRKIEELMRKFKEWLDSFIKSRIAGLVNFLAKDNATFIKAAKIRMNKLKSTDFKIKTKTLDITKAKEYLEIIKDFASLEKAEISTIESKIEELDGKKFEDVVRAEMEVGYDAVMKHLDFLAEFPGKKIKDLKADMKKARSAADKIVKNAKDAAKKADADKKDSLNEEVKRATKFRELVQKVCTFRLNMLKNEIKLARRVVTMFMGNRAVKEGYELEILEAMIESTEYELDEAVEQMSESEECELEEIEDEE